LVDVLLIEDDPRTVRFVRRGLEAEGFYVDVAENGEDALKLGKANDYPIVILDRILPGIDGMEICRVLRQEKKQCLILILTAKDALEDKIEGLRGGADDYLTKPFDFEELLARMAALLRRGVYKPGEPVLRVGDLILDPVSCKVRRGEREILLTAKELKLLAYLMENAGKVLSRSRILNHVWRYSFDPGTKVVDVYIRYLRRKIDSGEERALIKTVRSFGYTISE
jgi:two-component system OmpR family response regulator